MNCLECGYDTKLYTSGIWAGIWECQNSECGASDTHEHNYIFNLDGGDICLECGDEKPEPQFVMSQGERLQKTLSGSCR